MKKQIFKQAVALSLAVGVLAPSASALSWKDGALANYRFTYAGDNGGIESVEVSDTNDTFKGEIALGQTITTQTGTIAWRGSYTNTTTFTVTTKPGYELVGLSGANVEENDFSAIGENTYSFSFTDKGAEAWCYGKDVSFDLLTDKIDYTVNFYVDDELVKNTTSTVNDLLALPEEPAKEGYTFDGWYVDGQKLTDTTLTEDLIALADENNTIEVEGRYTVNEYPVTILYYNNNNNGVNGGSLNAQTDNIMVPYGTEINEAWLEENHRLSGYKMIGGDHDVTVGVNGAAIELVKKEENIESDHAYFTYESKDDGIVSVTYAIEDKREGVNVDVNETIRMSYSDTFVWQEKTITFTVQVAEGKALVLNCSDGSNYVTDNGDGTYTFSFTRGGYSGGADEVSFDLTTINK